VPETQSHTRGKKKNVRRILQFKDDVAMWALHTGVSAAYGQGYTDAVLRLLLLVSQSYSIKAAQAGGACTMSSPVTNHCPKRNRSTETLSTV